MNYWSNFKKLVYTTVMPSEHTTAKQLVVEWIKTHTIIIIDILSFLNSSK